ncbi:MAG: flagellar biosynthetic protein FliQ [Planctomycetota bacterium]
MASDDILDFAGRALEIAIELSLPAVLTAVSVGLLVSIFQAATQVQEQTLAVVPKIIAVFLVLKVMGAQLFLKISDYATELLSQIEKTGS